MLSTYGVLFVKRRAVIAGPSGRAV